MCGIFGIVAHNARVPEGLLERGTASLAHRGPDDSGTILLQESAPCPVEVGLGNRRLAILDLSPLAHQPMHDSASGNWIVYNGEIYNFREVRRELENLGASFLSQSDTEVVLKAYARWGPECLTRFRGMFAFALWDAGRHSLFIARDPMGIKPLYYAQTGAYLVFASEVRTLLRTGLFPVQVDPAGLTNFLTFGSSYDPLTLIESVRALPAGHSLTWHQGSVTEAQYWDLVDAPGTNGNTDSSIAATAAGLQAAIEEAVRMQLVSDVPVGVFLSGGIDSSALVSILSRGGVRPSTFSIVFREEEFSEAEHSRAVARKFSTDHHEITASQQNVLAAIPDALCAMDLPTMDGVNTYFVSRETRRAGVKVALSGLGGDEVFAGYSSFRSVPRMERFSRMLGTGVHARQSMGVAFRAVTPASDRNRKLALLMANREQVLHPYFISRILFTPDQCGQLQPETGDEIQQRATRAQREALDNSLALDPINRVSYLESRCYMLNTLLRDSDFMSMSQGLELRVPLIDHRLVKAVLSLPGKSKMNGTPKKLLVEAMQGSLPDEIVHRPKRGFTLPFDHWMRQEFRSEVEPVLQKKHVDAGPLGGLLNGKQVQKVWDDFLSGTLSWSRPWALYVLQRWCAMHL